MKPCIAKNVTRVIFQQINESHSNQSVNVLHENDKQRLIMLLPEEVWKLVLQKLKHTDIITAINASLFFRRERIRIRTLDVFPLVIKILGEIFEQRGFKIQECVNKISKKDDMFDNEDDEWEVTDDDENDYEEKEKTNLKFKWNSVVLLGRQVCFGWNKAIQNLYQDATMSGISEFRNDMDTKYPFNSMTLMWTVQRFSVFNDFEDPFVFLENFEDTHGFKNGTSLKNPLLGRHITIETAEKYHCEKQHEEFLSGVIKVLELIGHEVFYCHLNINFFLGPKLQDVLKLNRILWLLPNLKYLRVEGSFGKFADETFKDFTLPHFNHLEVLRFDLTNTYTAAEIIRKNCHIHALSLYHTTLDDRVCNCLSSIKNYTTSHSLCGEENLLNYGHQWKLTSLTMNAIQTLVGLKLMKLLHLNWNETLTDLTLDSPFGRDEGTVFVESKRLRLYLPHVRCFKVLNQHAFFLDFALPMRRSLEYLHFFWEDRKCSDHSQNVSRDQRIKLVGFRKKMYASNIWRFFPKLKVVETQIWGNAIRSFVFSNIGEKKKYRVMY